MSEETGARTLIAVIEKVSAHKMLEIMKKYCHNTRDKIQ